MWGISLVNIKTEETYNKFFGDPLEGNLAFDNVVPWKVESLTSLTDVVAELSSVIGMNNPVLVTYNVIDWSLGLWNSMCESSPLLKEMEADILDVKDVYYSIFEKKHTFDYPQDRAYKMFLRSKLSKKVGLVTMGDMFGLRLTSAGMPSEQPAAKALLTKWLIGELFNFDYPENEDDSEA